jgi:hypothetical protein
LQLVRRFRIPALCCALAVLLCELISQPFANMGVCDDWPYILMARTLATTGHIVYNGWAAPMLAWQLYLGAALVKLFGFSFTAVRSSTVLVAMAMAFVLQRTFVRSSLSEPNATLATLALVVSPLYLMLSVTYMTDIFGLFAIVICLYGCIRALQAATPLATILWLCFAVATNALCGTSRQIGWLGLLVMVPSTLWLLREQRRGLLEYRRVLLAGAAANLAGALFILTCLYWLKRQPYSIPEHVLPDTFAIVNTFRQLFYTFIDLPFLLLPLMVVFLPGLRKASRPVLAGLSVAALLYTLLALHDRILEPNLMLLPAHDDWVGIHGIYEGVLIQGKPPRFLSTIVQILLTIVSIGGFFGLIATVFRRPPILPSPSPSTAISWKQLGILLAPFAIIYILLLVPRAAKSELFGRYLLELLVVALLCLVRYYQERIQPQLPLAVPLVIAAMAVYGITVTHNQFSLYRARVALADELSAHGIPPTSVDNGWEYNLGVELQHAPSINFPTILVPAHAYVPTTPPLPSTCPMYWYDYTPHVRPLYSVSFNPNVCYGPAPFAPVHYSRWLARTPGTLYVVRYTPPTKP